MYINPPKSNNIDITIVKLIWRYKEYEIKKILYASVHIIDFNILKSV